MEIDLPPEWKCQLHPPSSGPVSLSAHGVVLWELSQFLWCLHSTTNAKWFFTQTYCMMNTEGSPELLRQAFQALCLPHSFFIFTFVTTCREKYLSWISSQLSQARNPAKTAVCVAINRNTSVIFHELENSFLRNMCSLISCDAGFHVLGFNLAVWLYYLSCLWR